MNKVVETVQNDEGAVLRRLFEEDAAPRREAISKVERRLRANRLERNDVRANRHVYRARRRLLVASLTVASVVVVVAALFAARASHHTLRSGAPSARDVWTVRTTINSPRAVQIVSSAGYEIEVPRSWKLSDQACGVPLADTVLFDQSDMGYPYCTMNQPNGLTVVTFEDVSYTRTLGWSKAKQVHVRLGAGRGVEAWVQRFAAAPKQLAIVGESLPVGLVIQGPDAAIRRIASTVRLVRVDPRGCLSEVRTLEPTQPARRGSRDSLIPGRPTSAAICIYSRRWLVESRTLSAKARSRIAFLLRHLKAGQTALPRTVTDRSGYCDALAGDFAVVLFGYSTGPTDVVFVHADGCVPTHGSAPIPGLSATNGYRSGQISTTLLQAIRYPFGYSLPR